MLKNKDEMNVIMLIENSTTMTKHYSGLQAK